MDIQGKVFIVTGGASGLGEGTARMLAANGGTADYNIKAPINLQSGLNFSTQKGSAGNTITYNVVNDAQALQASHNFYTYDNAFTAPVHGFASTEDYWARCSAKPHLRRMKHVPTLLLNARNDPMVPAWSLPTRAEVGPAVTLWQPHEGGHVGFPAGRFPGHVASLPDAVGQWLLQHL